MHACQSHESRVLFSLLMKYERHAPAFGKNAERILEAVGGVNLPAAKGNDFVVVPQAAAKGIGRFENVRDLHAAGVAHRHRRAERRMIDNPATLQAAEKVLDLIDRDRIANTDIDAAPFFKAAATVDADQIPLGVE